MGNNMKNEAVKSCSGLHLRSITSDNLYPDPFPISYPTTLLHPYPINPIPFTLVLLPPDPSLPLCDRIHCPCSSSQIPVPVPVPPLDSQPLLYINLLYLSIQDNLIIAF